MKVMQKYFLAIMPDGEFQDRVTKLKLEIKDRFQAKFALKSPAHITVKMPFIYNEAKEEKLIAKLSGFVGGYPPMQLKISGVRTFGKRVIYLGVDAKLDLFDFQRELKTFCKRELNLVDELSDRNFHPHMTVAFKDINILQFQNILNLVSERNFSEEICVSNIVLLKKAMGVWQLVKYMELR